MFGGKYLTGRKVNKDKQEIYFCQFWIAIVVALMERMNVPVKGKGSAATMNLVTKFFFGKNYCIH